MSLICSRIISAPRRTDWLCRLILFSSWMKCSNISNLRLQRRALRLICNFPTFDIEPLSSKPGHAPPYIRRSFCHVWNVFTFAEHLPSPTLPRSLSKGSCVEAHERTRVHNNPTHTNFHINFDVIKERERVGVTWRWTARLLREIIEAPLSRIWRGHKSCPKNWLDVINSTIHSHGVDSAACRPIIVDRTDYSDDCCVLHALAWSFIYFALDTNCTHSPEAKGRNAVPVSMWKRSSFAFLMQRLLPIRFD